jgi:hypothetical protein
MEIGRGRGVGAFNAKAQRSAESRRGFINEMQARWMIGSLDGSWAE